MIDGRSFYDQPINDSIKQYNEVRKVSTGQGDDYTTGCLLLMLISDADPRAIQLTAFQGVVVRADNTKIRLCTILEKSKETILQRNSKCFVRIYKWLNTLK